MSTSLRSIVVLRLVLQWRPTMSSHCLVFRCVSVDLPCMGAAAVDLCSVAVGRVNAFYERGLSPWDLAAGALIASEAGAIVGSLDGPVVPGGLIVAAPRSLFGPFRDLLIAAGAGDG